MAIRACHWWVSCRESFSLMLWSSIITEGGYLGAQSGGRKFSLDIQELKAHLSRGLLSREHMCWWRVAANWGLVQLQTLEAHQNQQCCLFKKYIFQPHIWPTESKSSRVGLENLCIFEAYQADCSRLTETRHDKIQGTNLGWDLDIQKKYKIFGESLGKP